MYLEDGREIYESDEYPGYFIDADTGNFCDEQGNYIGGNLDNGDKPGHRWIATPRASGFVYVSKRGCLYYPKQSAMANIPMSKEQAEQRGYKPSRGYQTMMKKQAKSRKR